MEPQTLMHSACGSLTSSRGGRWARLSRVAIAASAVTQSGIGGSYRTNKHGLRLRCDDSRLGRSRVKTRLTLFLRPALHNCQFHTECKRFYTGGVHQVLQFVHQVLLWVHQVLQWVHQVLQWALQVLQWVHQ